MNFLPEGILKQDALVISPAKQGCPNFLLLSWLRLPQSGSMLAENAPPAVRIAPRRGRANPA